MRLAIRVISLAGAAERRRLFAAGAERTTLDWRFFDAHTGAQAIDLEDDRAGQRASWGRELLPGELGCYSSHFEVWREFLASDDETLLVLEDDVVVDWGYMEFLAQHDFAALGVDYMRLFSKVPGRIRRVATPFLSPYYHLVEHRDKALGTQAYLMTREGARRMSRHCRVVRRPIDIEMDRSWANGLPNLQIFPPPVFERFSESQIGEKRLDSAGRRAIGFGRRGVEKLRKTVWTMQRRRATR